MTEYVKVAAPEVRDPKNVATTLANGPINMNVVGSFATITFTEVQPDVRQLFKGKITANDITAVVVARIALSLDTLSQFREMLRQAAIRDPPSGGGSHAPPSTANGVGTRQ